MGGSSKSSSKQTSTDRTKNINLQGNSNSPAIVLETGSKSSTAFNYSTIDPGSFELAESISVRALDLASMMEQGANSKVAESLTFAEGASRNAMDFAANYTPQDNTVVKWGMVAGAAVLVLVLFMEIKK